MPERTSGMEEAAIDFGGMIVSSIVMIILGLIYFAINLWIIRVASDFIFGAGALTANWATLAAALLAIGGMTPNFRWTKRIYRG